MRKYFYCFLCFLLCNAGQADQAAFSQYFHLDGDIVAAKEDVHGEFVIAGSTSTYGLGNVSAFVTKLKRTGIPRWTKTFSGDEIEYIFAFEETSDGGYLLAGETYTRPIPSEGSRPAMLVIKLNGNGSIEWKKKVESATRIQRATAISETTNGEFLVAGYSRSLEGFPQGLVVILRLGKNGKTLWTSAFQPIPTAGIFPLGIIQKKGGKYTLAADIGAWSATYFDGPLLLDLNRSGEVISAKAYSTRVNVLSSTRVIRTSDSGWLFAGDIFLKNGDAFAIRLDHLGRVMWASAFDILQSDNVSAVQETKDGGFLIAGHSTSTAVSDGFVIKTNAAGVVQWSRTIGQGGQNFVQSVFETSDRGFAVAGRRFVFENDTDDRLFFLKLDPDGRIPGCPLIRSRKVSVRPLSIQIAEPRILSADVPLNPMNASIRITKPQFEVSDGCSAVFP